MKVSIGKYPKKGKRKVSVKIDPHDTYNMDHTLAHIIVPMLVQLKKTKHGIPNNMFPKEHDEIFMDQEYWTEKKNGPLHKKEAKFFKEGCKKWDDTLDEMIWAFKEISNDYPGENKFWGKKGIGDPKGLDAYYKRIHAGTKLFGENYYNLWD